MVMVFFPGYELIMKEYSVRVLKQFFFICFVKVVRLSIPRGDPLGEVNYVAH